MPRRDFLETSAASAAAMGSIESKAVPQRSALAAVRRGYGTAYTVKDLNRIAFPLAGWERV